MESDEIWNSTSLDGTTWSYFPWSLLHLIFPHFLLLFVMSAYEVYSCVNPCKSQTLNKAEKIIRTKESKIVLPFFKNITPEAQLFMKCRNNCSLKELICISTVFQVEVFWVVTPCSVVVGCQNSSSWRWK